LVIKEVLCGRSSDPPAEPARAGALAALVVGQLAHRLFLDAADVRIVEFVRQLHQQTGADPHLLDAVLRGLLGERLPQVADPLTPLLLLGRGLVVALELDEQTVTELVVRAEQQLPEHIPESPAAFDPQPSSAPIPTSQPGSQPAAQGVAGTVPTPQGVAGPAPIPQGLAGTAPAPPRHVTPSPGMVRAAPPNVAQPAPATSHRLKTPYLVGGIIAVLSVLVLVAVVALPVAYTRDSPTPAPTISTAPPGSDPREVAQAFAAALNNQEYDRATELLCAESRGMTRHVAKGQLRVQEFTVGRVETQNSTTAYIMAKATIDSQAEPLVWRGTLRTAGGDWCVLDIHPEDDSPPAQPETREVAFEKMRTFITLVNKADSVKAMSYVCGTQQSIATEAMIQTAIDAKAQLAVTPDPESKGATTYNGSVTGRTRLPTVSWDVSGTMTISRDSSGIYCISYFELRYE
jgi:hypothetical protein